MKAAQFNKYGDTSVIEINQNADKPTLSEGQILVQVYATGINPFESAVRNGYMAKIKELNFPVTLGGDFSGKIIDIHSSVANFKVGDQVYGNANPFKGGSGAVAEFVAAKVDFTALKPLSLSHEDAASLPLAGTSALQAIEEHIKLKSGQKILIHGGAGGIGSIAIQIAKAHGAFVATTVSSNDVEFAKKLGADQVIDYKTQDFSELIKDYDAVFDTVGGDKANKSIPVLRQGGILVSMAGQANPELVKSHKVTAISQKTKGDSIQLTRLAELADAGQVIPIVDKVFDIEQTKEAYIALESHPQGKVVIKI